MFQIYSFNSLIWESKTCVNGLFCLCSTNTVQLNLLVLVRDRSLSHHLLPPITSLSLFSIVLKIFPVQTLATKEGEWQ
jgi:hypothetical protein